MSRARRIAAVLLASVAAGVGVAAYLLHPRELTPRVESILGETLRGRARIGRVAWIPPWGVEVRAFVMTATSGEPVLSVDRLTARVEPAPLLAGHLALTAIRARGVTVTLARSSTHAGYRLVEAFLPRAPADPSAPPSEFTLALDALTVEGLDVSLDEPGRRARVRGATVTGARLDLDPAEVVIAGAIASPRVEVQLADGPAIAGRAAVDGVSVRWDRRLAEGTLAAARGWLDVPGGALGLTDASLGPLAASGAPPRVHARAEATLALAALAPFLARAPWLAATGTVAVDARVVGLLGAPSITATITAGGLGLLGHAVDAVALRGAIDGSTLSVHHLTATIDGAPVEGRGSLARDGAVAVEARAKGVDVRRWADSAWLPARASGELRAQGTLQALTVEVGVSGGGARLGVRGRVECKAPCTLGQPQTHLDLAVELAHGGLAPLIVARVPGATLERLTVSGRLRGPLARPEIAAEVGLTGLGYARLPPIPGGASLRAALRVDGPRLEVAAATLTSSVGRASAVGSVLLPLYERAARPIELGLEVSTTSVSLAWLSRGAVRGALSARGRVAGEPGAPQASADLRVDGLALPSGLALAPAALSVRAEGGAYTLAPATLSLIGGGTVRVEGRTNGAQLSARALASELPLAVLTRRDDVSGALDAAVSVEGTLAAPIVDAELEGAGWVLAGLAFSSMKASARGPLEALAMDARLVGLGGTVKVEGTVDPRALELVSTTVLARNLALPDVGALGELDGRLDAELAVSGPLRAPAVSGRAVLRQLAWKERLLGLDALTVELGPRAAGLYQLDARLGAGLAVRGLLTLEPALGFSGFAEARALGLRPAVEAAIARGLVTDEGAISTADGVLGGYAELSYDARGLRTLAELRQLELSTGDLKLALDAPATVSFAGGELTVGRLRLSGRRGGIEVEGTAGEALDLRAKADVNAAVLSLASRQVQDATGRFDVEATVKGPRDAPQVEASLLIHEPVVVRPRAMVREVVLSSGRVRATRERITVDGLDGAIAGGTFHLGGSVGLRGGRPDDYDLSLDGASLPLRTRDLAVEANLSVHLGGGRDLARLAGRLDIVRARYQKGFRLENFAFVADKRGDEPTLAERLPWLADLELDLRAQSAGDIELAVDANGVEVSLALGADVTVTGTPLDPRLGGRIHSDRGALVFPRAELEVTTADIDLDPFHDAGSSGITVHLVAEGELPAAERNRTHLVRLTLDGPLEQMSLDLASAGLDRLAVLALLVTGRTALDRDGALAFAGSQLTAPILGFVEDKLEKALNLDLDLEAELSTEALRITASKQITPRLTIETSLQRDFDAAGTLTTAVRAVLSLFDRAFLEARTSQRTQSASTPASTAAGEASSTSVELRYQLLGR